MDRITRNHALAFMLLCLLIAAALRFHILPQVPPGLHYDEAANAILTAEISRGESLPIFIESYTGKEVFFFYMAAGLTRLVGESLFALRLTAAFIGLLTIAATYWLGRELGLSRPVALLAATLVAVSFWHLLFSRLGFRAISQPLLQALTVAALFRGIRRGQWRWLVFSGIFLGLTAYTYLAARLFPVLLLLALLPLLLNRKQWQVRWAQLGVTAVTALLILSPLLYYFVTHPAAFWVRIGQVGTSSDGLTQLGGYIRALEMFFLRGDPYIRFNVPDEPLFSLMWGTLLVGGWIVMLTSWKRLQTDWQRSATLLLLAAPLIMILPTALATNEILPSNLRAIGMIPFLFYLPAKGVEALLAEMAKRYQRPQLMTRGFLTIILVLMLVEGVYTAQTYFQEWGKDPALFYETDGDLTAVAAFLNDQNLTDQTVYVAAKYYQPPTIAYLSDAYGAIKWLPESKALALPEAGAALYVFPHTSPLPAWAEPFFAGAEIVAQNDSFTAYRLDAAPPVTPPNAQTVHFDSVVTLLGYDVAVAPAGETMPVTLYWRVDGLPRADYLPFVHLEDKWGHRWSQAEAFAYPVAQWQPGDVVIQRVDLPITAGAPPGDYQVRVGFFNPDSGDRLPVVDGNGRYAGDSTLIEKAPVTVGAPPNPLPQPPIPVGDEVQPGLNLLGYQWGSKELTTGETLDIALWWLATKQQPHFTTRLELYKRDKTGRILGAGTPNHNTYPFESWETPQFLIDNLSMPIPDSVTDGEYRILLHLFNSSDDSVYKKDLGWITVTQTERNFEVPEMETAVNSIFGNEINLLGYNLSPNADGYVLDLIWQAQTTPAADYTVFVHLLNPDGTCCAWQQDAMPRQNTYPTSRWLPKEIVVDSYQIVIPEGAEPGVYLLEVGLYNGENGRRLQVQNANNQTSDAVNLEPIVIQEN
ncbi:MAG: glycosyltransferase family 39 protein [Anaerolineae bacterium]|nr:glycosyltransferase family 39 protein [Anaerolineae bacterium]